MLYRDVDRLPFLHGLRRCAETLGLSITLVRHQQAGKEDWGQKLRRGEVEVIAENYWALQRYRAAGVPFVTVGSSSHVWTELLLAQPGITKLADLRGKKLAARLTGPQASFPRVLLERAGFSKTSRSSSTPNKTPGAGAIGKKSPTVPVRRASCCRRTQCPRKPRAL